MGDPRKNDLALLFALATVPIVGCAAGVEDEGSPVWSTTAPGTTQAMGGDDDSGDEGTGDTGNASDPSGGGGDPTSAGTTITTDPSGGSMTDPTAPAMTDPSAASMTDPTYGGSYGSGGYGTYGGSGYGGGYGTGGGGMIPPVCYGFASHYSECQPMADYGMMLDYCAGDMQYGAMVGGQCGSALEEFYACMSMADCQQILMGDPCGGAQLGSVCGGG